MMSIVKLALYGTYYHTSTIHCSIIELADLSFFVKAGL